MKEPAVGRSNKLLSMKELGPSKVIKEKIDRMDMDDVSLSQMSDNRRRYRVTARAKKWNTDDIDPLDGIAGSKACPLSGALKTRSRVTTRTECPARTCAEASSNTTVSRPPTAG